MRTCVFHVSGNVFAPFPAKHHTRRIWEELAIGVDEYHVIACGKGFIPSHTVSGNIHLHLIPSVSGRMLEFFVTSWLLFFYMLRYKPTHLVVQCPVVGGVAAAALTRLFNVKLFVELHGTHYFATTKPGLLGRLEHAFYRSLSTIAFNAADKIRSLSEDMSTNLCRVYGMKYLSKIVVIPTRVDLSIFNVPKKTYEIHGPMKVISVGSYIPGKNHVALIKDLFSTGLDIHLTLVGFGNLVDEYKRVADELGVASQITLIGGLSHTDLAKLLNEQDIYVHYSLAEGLSRAILEAMAIGLPVIATRVGFIEGLLIDHENCVLIDQPWSTKLQQALKLLHEKKTLRVKLGNNARVLIETRFESKRVFNEYRQSILGI